MTTGTALLSRAIGAPVAVDERNPIAAATILHGAGLSVFPMPYGSKDPWAGYHWQVFKTTRLAEADLETAFEGVVNLAVMTGRQSGNLLVVDCETPASFGVMCNRVLRAGSPLWAANTARGGHVYLACTDGEIANLKASEVEVRGNSCYVLAPPSLHPTGALYYWLRRDSERPPALPLRTLRDTLGLCLNLATRKGKGQGLSENTQAFLDGRIPEGERNPQLYTSARELLASGYGEETARDLLVDAAQVCGLSAREAHKTFDSAVKGHEQDGYKVFSRNRDKPSAWAMATVWAKSRTWSGRTGGTDKAVFLAHCERMHRDTPHATKAPTWRASQRELAELAQTRQETATKATQRLVDYGLLVRLPGERHEANRYQLGEVVIGSLVRSASSSDPVTTSVSDAFERGALPRNSIDLLEVLQQEDYPAMPTALSRKCGLTVQQVRWSLSRLAVFGLVKHSPDGWLLAVFDLELPEELERVAFEAGTMGKGQRRKEQHELDRQRYALRMVQRARSGASKPSSPPTSTGRARNGDHH